ncbi:alpha/beta fold hydrolase [Sinomonas sp. P10A9]|uniref:Alpha/beta fold hydrolase n=1 Tax=Sinomonas puerhi TaxID=3238584 RepID=A0AB39L6E1_9MICC
MGAPDTAETFVLVHGAWHGGWGWRPAAARLEAAGHAVHAPTSPGLAPGDDPTGVGLADAVDALVAYVERHDLRNVALVGHSWGGFLLSAAAPRLADRIVRLVYINAFVPLAGESMVSLIPERAAAMYAQRAAASVDNTTTVPLELWKAVFMQDAVAEVQELVHSLLTPHPFATLTDPAADVDYAALGVPLAYVGSREDLAMVAADAPWPPPFAERLPGRTFTEIGGSHASILTRPAEVADALLALMDVR